jgi:hypothetical protein
MHTTAVVDETICSACRAERHDECTHRRCSCAVAYRWRAIRSDLDDAEMAGHAHPGARRLVAA